MLTGATEIELIEGRGGAFEITRDGTLVYSKHATNRFPTDEELVELMS